MTITSKELSKHLPLPDLPLFWCVYNIFLMTYHAHWSLRKQIFITDGNQFIHGVRMARCRYTLFALSKGSRFLKKVCDGKFTLSTQLIDTNYLRDVHKKCAGQEKLKSRSRLKHIRPFVHSLNKKYIHAFSIKIVEG